MTTKKRRDEILKLLAMDTKPVSANTLADRFGVSRQIIVGDIALLRAAGQDITATQSGYVLSQQSQEDALDADTYILSCRHDKVQLEQELYTVVDNGGVFLNVSVDHPLYGTITQNLNIGNRYEADEFIQKVAVTGGSLLSSLTEGAHLHTIRCPSPEAYRRILSGLREKSILFIK